MRLLRNFCLNTGQELCLAGTPLTSSSGTDKLKLSALVFLLPLEYSSLQLRSSHQS